MLIFFEHPDTVDYECEGDSLRIDYGGGLITMSKVQYMEHDSFSLVVPEGDVLVFDRMD